MRSVAIILLVLGVPTFAFASPYFEFAPDYSHALMIQPGQTVSQIFAPLNDYISVIDLWVGTGGLAAGIDVTLQNPSGTVIATKTVSLGMVADVAGGTRMSIALPSRLTVNGGEAYRINITPTGSAVKLYYSASVSVVPGSTSGDIVSYRYGTAVVNGQPQGFSFKFALSEAAETTSPVATEVQILQPAIGQAMFSFRASEPVDVQIVYGSRTAAWTGQFNPCLPGITSCSVYLPVIPGTTYPYTATLKEAWGNTTLIQGSFTALGEGPGTTPSGTVVPVQPSIVSGTPAPSVLPDDGMPPVILNPRLLELSPTSATVAWTTDESADTSVVLLGEGIYAYDDTRELEHYTAISGLLPDHYYRMRVSSTDFWGNYSDALIMFTTPLRTDPSMTTAPIPDASAPPTPAPSYTVVVVSSSPPSAVSVVPSPSERVPASSGGTAAASPTPSVVAYPSTSTGPGEIRWLPASGDVDGYRIDIFDENGTLITSLTVEKDVTSLQLPAGVPKGSRVIVYANRGGAFEKVGVTTVTDRPLEPAPWPLTPVLKLVGSVTLLVALVVTWVLYRRRQRVAVDATTSVGLGGGPGRSAAV